MPRPTTARSLAALAALAALVTASAGMAMAGTGFEIVSSTIDGGGKTSSSAAYQLTGTVGQPDAAAPVASATYEFAGGFWPGAGPVDTPCPGDTNGDLRVDIDDIVNVVLDFGCTQPPACPSGGDVNGDDVVNIDDIVFVVLNFGNVCS